MRYFLALDAYLEGTDAPAAQRFERRLALWHAAVERYPRQLHEADLAAYLENKRGDMAREAAKRP